MLINCVAYQDGKRLAEIQPDEIHHYLAMPGCFVWVALLERDPDAARADAGAVRPAPARGRGRAERPSAAEDRGLRRFALRRAAPARGGRRGPARRRGRRVRGPELHPDHPQPRRERLPVRACALRGRARTAEARLGLRALRADRRGRGPLLPAARRPRDRARRDRGPHLRRRLAARERRGPLWPQAEARRVPPRGRAAARGRQQPLRRAGAANLRGHEGLFPRHLRPPAAPQPDHRVDPRHDRDRDRRQPLDDQPAGERDHEAARGLWRAGRRADDDRRHLRHELRAHAGARLEVRLRAPSSRSWCAIDVYLFYRLRKAKWL